MELPQELEPWTSLSSISNLNHFAKSTCVCAHEKSFYIYNLNCYIEKHKVLYMSIELLCCNLKLQHALLTQAVYRRWTDCGITPTGML
jgi:hypothetical protein